MIVNEAPWSSIIAQIAIEDHKHDKVCHNYDKFCKMIKDKKLGITPTRNMFNTYLYLAAA